MSSSAQKSTATARSKKEPLKKEPKKQEPLVFGKKNYWLLGAGFVILIIGFFLMSGPDDATKYSSRRITLAPIVVMIGFAVAGYSIFYKEKTSTPPSSEE